MGPEDRKQRAVAILGSTGSIGRSTLELLDLHPDWFRVTSLTAASRVDVLAEQVERYRPRIAAIANPDLEGRLQARCRGMNCEVVSGPDGLIRAATVQPHEATRVVGQLRKALG